MVPLRAELQGTANVYRPQTNCGPLAKDLKKLTNGWRSKVSVIQINHGLHDLKYMGPQGQNLADPKNESSHQQIPPDQYAANLDALANASRERVRKSFGVRQHPFRTGAAGRVVGDSAQRNCEESDVYTELKQMVSLISRAERPHTEANVHYTPENSTKLAKFVADSIRKEL